MRAALADITGLTADGRQAFVQDRAAQQAVAYNLAVLGEAARALSGDLRDRHPEVPWGDVIAQRNVVVHEYHRLDLDILWATISNDVPALRDLLATIEHTEQSDQARPDAS